MQYALNQENYHRFDIFEVNKLPPRAYFIPFGSREEAQKADLLHKRSQSSKVRLLSGIWDFHFYPAPGELPKLLDTDNVEFSPLAVPGCWQFQGYDRPFYVNYRYLFPFDPPHIPQNEPVGEILSMAGADQGVGPRVVRPENAYNFVGVYRKKLTLEAVADHMLISFLGVASCLELYCNGAFVGYSEGSHNTAEFDLTEALRSGENELMCIVRRWCNGSYLECQDMFRNTGIFRDVLLYSFQDGDVRDVTFTPVKTDAGYDAKIHWEQFGGGPVAVSLTGPNVEVSREVTTDGAGELTFTELIPTEWNAEAPTLYDLTLQTPGGFVALRVGFKSVRIQKDVFTLNGAKLKLRGVNHHDTSPTGGYTLTPEEIERDILLCKRYNVDTVRTSHYPPDPLLLELCDEYGIYVVDEADLETHGTMAHQLLPSYNTLTQDPKWAGHYLDRAKRLYGRDKNHPSILMWSLGNESGGYHNTDIMYDWLKTQTDLPVHYEGVIHSRRIAYDVGSEMYPPVSQVRKVGQHSRKEAPLNDRPYFLCEYAHAMGVGPGAIEEYWQEIFQFDNLMGGCVWEMVDHAVLHPDGSYTYGGDHGEWVHDGNFCVDGLFYPDRTPSTGARIVRHTYRPIRTRHVGGNRYEFFNTMAFTDAAAYEITLRFSDGRALRPKLSLAPLSRKTVAIPGAEAQGEWVNVEVCRDGKLLSREQLIFRLELPGEPEYLPQVPAGLDVVDGRVFIHKDGKCLTVSDPYTILFRAPTDNDLDLTGSNAQAEQIGQEETVEDIRVEADRVIVKTRIRCRRQIFTCTDVYRATSQGIAVESTLRCIQGLGKLPRFGKAFRLEESFDDVTYKARSGESYRDMKEQFPIRQVQCRVADMTEPNIRPQESGNRCDCLFATLSDGATEFTFRALDKPFELGVKPYSDRALLTMRHREDETRTGTYVTASAFQMGIGTGSCGPLTLPEYCFKARQTYTLRFLIE